MCTTSFVLIALLVGLVSVASSSNLTASTSPAAPDAAGATAAAIDTVTYTFTSSSSSSSSSFSSSSSSSTATPTATTTATAPGTTHTVTVGLVPFAYQPDTILAGIGDVVEWNFYPLNHSVVHAAYGYPCIPYEYTGHGLTGFFSGIQDLENGIPTPVPTFRITINDSSPIFFYCSTPGSCNVKGMVGVINPNSSFTLAFQKSLALQAAFALSPGDAAPAETGSLTSLASIYASATSTSTSTSTDSSSSSSQSPATAKSGPLNHNRQLSVGEIVGIVIGSLADVALLAALCFFVGRSHTYSKLYKADDKRNSDQSRSTTSGLDMAAMDNDRNTDWKYGSVSYAPLSSSAILQSPSAGFLPTYERQELGHEQSEYIQSLETRAHHLPFARRLSSTSGSHELESRTPLEME